MAKFEIAEEITGRFEGGYANNKADRGGETFAGIARNHWPKWEGWNIIDRYKDDYARSNKKLSLATWVNNSAKVRSEPIGLLISKFYKDNFWDVLKLDYLTDQQLANSVYDFAVNSGTYRASTTLQNAVNDTGLVKLVVDGKIGPKTIESVNTLNPEVVYNKYNSRRESFYRSIAKGNQVQFLKSWLNRLKPYKSC